MKTNNDAGQAFLDDFNHMSTFGATPGGGIDRQAATDADCSVREWLSTKIVQAGGKVIFDEIGNQFGLFEFIPGAPYILVGSHLDSQPLAGRFDGSYGVLAALHAVQAIADDIRASSDSSRSTPSLTANLAVVNWFNEEGSRFTPSMMGSSVYTGSLPFAQARAAQDSLEINVAAAQHVAKWTPVAKAPEATAYAEIHVEQGKILEETNTQIGLVVATWGARKIQVTVRGEQGHTGSTLMEDRHDALFGASLVIAEVRRLTDELKPATLQASVSQMTVLPNSPVTIAREVVMNIDLRSPEAETLTCALERLADIVTSAEAEARVSIDIDLTHQWNLNPYPAEGVELARGVAEDLGLSHREIYTVAGHDSTNMKDQVPTVMLFVPSKDGISHNEAELTSDEDMLAGLAMLEGVLRKLMD